jgi:hypothetical protein
VVKNLTKRACGREDRFSKTLFGLSRCRITENDGSGDLLSQSQIHIDEQDEVVLPAQQQMRLRPRCIGGCSVQVCLLPWQSHVFIRMTCLGLQHPVTN